MLQSERMISVSVLCVASEVELVLEALGDFGEFHVVQASENQNVIRFSQSILKVEESLAIINYLEKKLPTPKPFFLDIFKFEGATKVNVYSENWQTLQEATRQQITSLNKEVNDFDIVLSSLQNRTTQLKHTKSMLSTMDQMGVDLEALEDLKLIKIEIAAVPHKNLSNLKVALTNYPVIVHRCYLTKETDFMCFAMPSKHKETIEKILKTHHSEIFQISQELPHNITLALKEVNNQLKQSENEEKKVTIALEKLGRENRHKIASWKETVENILSVLEVESKILQSGRLANIKGFVPKKKFPLLTQKIRGDLNGKVLVLENEPEPVADPPTMVSHNRFVKPFEEITKLYGLPHYDELDPTPLIAITFPLIFGLMFGDMGHGLLLLIGGLTLGTLIKKGQSIKNVCMILAACGVGSIAAGALFGEFFGIQLFAALWFSPFDNVLMFLIFSLVVGVIQIVSGIVLEMVNFILKRNIIDVLLTSVPKIAFYIGSVSLIVLYQLNFDAWFKGPILFAIVPFGVLVFAKPIFSAAKKLQWSSVEVPSEQTSIGQRLFESGDLVIRLLSNTISYTRILALLMAHWALILVVYTIVGLIGSASILTLILSGIIIVAGNIFVIALEGLIVFIHTMRLHFYEWFSKFYTGTGTPFSPFKQKFVYTKVEFTKKTLKS